MRVLSLTLVACVTLVLAACSSSSDSSEEGAGLDVTDASVEALDAIESVDHDEGEGETPPLSPLRLYRVEDEADLLTGWSARGRVGDLRLENERAVFLIRGGEEPGYWGPFGGSLIDADVRRAPGEEGRELLGEIIPIIGHIRSFRPTAFEIVADGSDGVEAILRVTGTDAGIPLIDAALATAPLGLEVTLEYRLRAGSPLLEMVTTVRNPTDDKETVLIGDAAILGDRLQRFYAGMGLYEDAPSVKPSLDYVIGLGEGVGYGLFPAPGETLNGMFDREELELFQLAKPKLAPGEQITLRRYFGVSGGSAAPLVAAWRELAGEPPAVVVTGQVMGLPPEIQARDLAVLALDLDGAPLAHARPDAGRRFELALPAAGEITLQARVADLGVSERVAVVVPAEGADDLELQAPPSAVLEVGCEEVGSPGVDLPCRVSLQAGLDAAPQAHVLLELYAGPGRHRFVLPPGDYTVTASRGFEYELAREELSLADGGEQALSPTLVRAVDTAGWVATTVHVHSELSIDSDLPMDLRLYALAAAGMEHVYPTEHDVLVDYTPYIDELGLDGWLTSDVGCEFSPLYGHFNCLGCDLVPGEFPVPWVAYTEDGHVDHALKAPEIWEGLREVLGAPIIQINHPYSTQGFFVSIDFDPERPIDEQVGEDFNTGFDTIELFNSHDDLDDLYLETLPAWYSMLNQGVRPTGVGAEDTHDDRGTGTPRTLVAVTEDRAGAIDRAAVIEGLKTGRAVVSQGPFPELWVNDVPIGGQAESVDGEVQVRVRVQAPSWIELSSARLLRDGEVVETFDLEGRLEPVRLDETLSLEESGPAWYVLLVEGDAHRLGPLYNGDSPFAITNPVFVGP
jgi:hypothetical protein